MVPVNETPPVFSNVASPILPPLKEDAVGGIRGADAADVDATQEDHGPGALALQVQHREGCRAIEGGLSRAAEGEARKTRGTRRRDPAISTLPAPGAIARVWPPLTAPSETPVSAVVSVTSAASVSRPAMSMPPLPTGDVGGVAHAAVCRSGRTRCAR